MGDYPVEAVSTMSRVAREIEKDETHFTPMIDMNMVSVNHEITAQLARSAVRASTNLPIRYVVLDTATGRTGRYLAAFRGRCQVLAVCYTRMRSVFWLFRTASCRSCVNSSRTNAIRIVTTS